jgi:hypothetical protein
MIIDEKGHILMSIISISGKFGDIFTNYRKREKAGI